MKPADRHTLTLFLAACPTEALREVLDTPLAGWGFLKNIDMSGRRCLVGIAAGAHRVGTRAIGLSRPEIDRGNLTARLAFDACVVEGGLRGTVRVCKEIARRVLANREAKS